MKQLLELIGGLAAIITVFQAFTGEITFQVLILLSVITGLLFLEEQKDKKEKPTQKPLVINHYENFVVEKQ